MVFLTSSSDVSTAIAATQAPQSLDPSGCLTVMYVVGGLIRDKQGEIDWQYLLVSLKNAQGELKVWCGAMPVLRHADLSDSDTSNDPLKLRVSDLYAQLLQNTQQKTVNDEALWVTGHCYMMGGNQHALPVENFQERISFTALGYLHLAQMVDGDESVRYSGTPIPLQERIETVVDSSDLEEVYNIERHLLSAACNRAWGHLLVTSVNPASEFLDVLRM